MNECPRCDTPERLCYCPDDPNEADCCDCGRAIQHCVCDDMRKANEER